MKTRARRWITSLSAKYMALFALLVAVPAVAIGAYTLTSSYDHSKNDLIRLQEEKAKSVAETIREVFDQTTTILSSYRGADESFHERGIELRPLLGLHTVEAFYVDGAGRATVAYGGGTSPTSPNRNYSVLPFFKIARKTGTYYGPVRAPNGLNAAGNNASGGAARSMEIAVAESAGPGVVGEVLDLGGIQDLVKGTRIGTTGYAYAVDSTGRPIAHPNAKVFTLRSLTRLPQVATGIRSPQGWTTGRNFRRQQVVSAWATVSPLGWRVFIEAPESEAFAPIRGTLWRTVLFIVALVLAGLAASVLLARRLVRPIKRMQTAAAQIGAGAYGERIELDRRDELGQLADELNKMAASLQDLISGLEQKVRERTHELEAASRHKSDFLANMSHELRTPLNAIVGFSQVLQQKLFGEVNEKQEEYLDDILSSANHLLALINDILDLSKVEAGQIELERATFSLREALERGIVMVRERATGNGVQLALELDPSVDLIEGDERRIRQVVFNLLSNAVKFTPEGGRVDVTTARSDGEVRVAVTDTGPGIAAADQERIFEEFQQAQSGSEGTGLGLALSKSLVELHGGRIWVESEPGHGSAFMFTLPLGS